MGYGIDCKAARQYLSGVEATVIITGDYVRVTCPGHRSDLYDALEGPFSYEVAGSEFSDLRREQLWDGRKRLVTRSGPNGVRFPAGLWAEANHLLGDAGFNLDVRSSLGKPRAAVFGCWGSHPLRDYQSAAQRIVSLRRGVTSGGILKMPIRSGKTLTAAAVIRDLGLRAMFIAPSDFLVEQAWRVFREALPDANVTVVGAGLGDDASGDLVVMSIATLAARSKSEWTQAYVRDAFSLIIVDEVHHICAGAAEWRDAVLRIRAHQKIGLSGTLNEDDACASLWSRAICGPVLYSVPMRRMVEEGHLLRGKVDFLRYSASPAKDPKWTRRTYADEVVGCKGRNDLIVREATLEARLGRRVLVDVSRIGHARALGAALRTALGRRAVAVLTGSSKDAERRRVLGALASGEICVVISTVMGEGVDVPELEVVINAEGGRAGPSAVQRLRNLTARAGKVARIVEPLDAHHPILAEWARSRARMYKGLGCFDLRLG